MTSFYRIANPVVHSLRHYHGFNTTGWSSGPVDKTRWGCVFFSAQTEDEDRRTKIGATSEGATIVPAILWDGDRNRFVGPAALRGLNKPLCQVDTDWSKDFQALSPKPNQLVIEGGERGGKGWHLWETAVPEGYAALMTISIPQTDGTARTIDRTLEEGAQMIVVDFKPIEGAKTTSLTISCGNDKEKLSFDLPPLIGEHPSNGPVFLQTLNVNETVQLLKQSLKDSKESVTIDFKLLAR